MTEELRKQILLVDDEESLTKLCRDYLSSSGYRVFLADCLGRAREVLRTETIHLVLCDLTLKDGESGLDLLEEILPKTPNPAVCMMTARHDIRLAIDCLRDGAFDFITKPFSLVELKESVERALSRRNKMIAEREEAEGLIRALARFPEDNPNPVFRVDAKGKILYSNRAGQPLLKEWRIDVGDPLPAAFLCLLRDASFNSAADKPAKDSESADDLPADDERYSGAFEVNSGDRIFSFSATRIVDSECFYLYGHDVTDWKKAEKELVRMKNEATDLSFRDQLTGMTNRSYLESRYKELSVKARKDRTGLAFLLLDLDNFKEVNDIYGHETGDRVLIQVGRRLGRLLGPNDILCRWGGDEIVILKSDVRSVAEVDDLCRDVLETGRNPLKTPGQTFPITLSIGYTLFPEDGSDLDALMQRADHALYRAKEMGKNTWKAYRQLEKKEIFRQSPNLLVRFNEAVNDGDIDVNYQPIVDAATGRSVAVEALARWTDPELGPIPPGNFIPEAEERGLIGRLGKVVLRKALDDLVRWRAGGVYVTLSVNLSRRQLLNREFITFVNAQMEERDLPSSALTLEITERHSFFDTAIGRTRLGELAEAGYGLSLDDFGTGYSSLSEMASMPFDELKIAINLTRQITDTRGRKIVHAISLMGRALGLSMVAEGVETKEQAHLLRMMGIPRLQGYLFARPMEAEAFFEFAQSRELIK